jgi:hypothetical protein
VLIVVNGEMVVVRNCAAHIITSGEHPEERPVSTSVNDDVVPARIGRFPTLGIDDDAGIAAACDDTVLLEQRRLSSLSSRRNMSLDPPF